MNDVADTPDDRRSEHDDYYERYENGEDERKSIRHPGLQCLLNGPDERHAKESKCDWFNKDTGEVEGCRHQHQRKKDANETAGRAAARRRLFLDQFSPSLLILRQSFATANKMRSRAASRLYLVIFQ